MTTTRTLQKAAERLLDEAEHVYKVAGWDTRKSEAFTGLKDALAQEQEQEPPHGYKLARQWAEKWASIDYEDPWKHAAREVLALLAAAPQPAVQPLTDEEAKHIVSLIPSYFEDKEGAYGLRVFRAAEGVYGIGVNK